MTWTPPTADQLLAIAVCADLPGLVQHERFAAATPDLVEAIAEGIGQFATGEWAPLARIGDTEGARYADGKVILPAGYAEAYAQFVAQGWGAIDGPEDVTFKKVLNEHVSLLYATNLKAR